MEKAVDKTDWPGNRQQHYRYQKQQQSDKRIHFFVDFIDAFFFDHRPVDRALKTEFSKLWNNYSKNRSKIC